MKQLNDLQLNINPETREKVKRVNIGIEKVYELGSFVRMQQWRKIAKKKPSEDKTLQTAQTEEQSPVPVKKKRPKWMSDINAKLPD